MAPQLLIAVGEVPGASPKEWPSQFFRTSTGFYEYYEDAFRATPPPRNFKDLTPPSFKPRLIKEVRGDGEDAVVILEDGSMFRFFLQHLLHVTPTPDPISWPMIEYMPHEEAASFDISDMDPLPLGDPATPPAA